MARPVSVGQPVGFGVEGYELAAESEGGGPVTQAGAHPFQMTGSILLDQGQTRAWLSLRVEADAGPVVPAREMVARLPPGLIANPSAVPRCLSWQFAGPRRCEQDRCPYQSAVGVASVTFDQGGLTRTVATPVFNIEPEAGEPARFGFYVPLAGVPVTLTTSVRSSEDWGVDLSSSEIPQDSGISSVRVTFWGVAASALHDDARGWGVWMKRVNATIFMKKRGVTISKREPPAFVTLPTSCTCSLASSVEADSWAAPGAFQSFPASEPLATVDGLRERAVLAGDLDVHNDGFRVLALGVLVRFDVSREGLTSGSTIAESNVEKTVVSLPEGLTIDPSAGVGLGACSPAQYAEVTLDSPEGAGCPEDSKLGTVEVETPLLFTTVYGSLYVAQPYDNPFPEAGHPGGSLIALYVVAKSRAERGVLVKLAGRVSADPATGRLTVTFEHDPPLQFDKFNFHFREGAQAPLISPATCGSYTTTANLFPYSAPEDPLTDTASFQVTSGSEGSACPTASRRSLRRSQRERSQTMPAHSARCTSISRGRMRCSTSPPSPPSSHSV